MLPWCAQEKPYFEPFKQHRVDQEEQHIIYHTLRINPASTAVWIGLPLGAEKKEFLPPYDRSVGVRKDDSRKDKIAVFTFHWKRTKVKHANPFFVWYLTAPP